MLTTNHRLYGGPYPSVGGNRPPSWQWQPPLLATHDPHPPIEIEGGIDLSVGIGGGIPSEEAWGTPLLSLATASGGGQIIVMG